MLTETANVRRLYVCMESVQLSVGAIFIQEIGDEQDHVSKR
jgi:hypothetical protein